MVEIQQSTQLKTAERLTISGSESDLKVRLQLDDAAREEMEENNSQTMVEIQQSTQLKTAERLRFEQHTKHLLEVANLPADVGQVNISASKFAHLADGTAICALGDTR